MNCEVIREKINDALAAGEPASQEPEIALHLQHCPGCNAFLANQGALYRAIESGLIGIANPVQTPLLAGVVRERLQQKTSTAPWIYSLWPAFAALLIACALLFRIDNHPSPDGKLTVALNTHNSTEQNISGRSDQSLNAPGNSSSSTASPPKLSTQARNPSYVRTPVLRVAVIVDPAESLALHRLAQGINQNPQWGSSLISAGALSDDSAVSIPSLAIAELELPALADDAR